MHALYEKADRISREVIPEKWELHGQTMLVLGLGMGNHFSPPSGPLSQARLQPRAQLL